MSRPKKIKANIKWDRPKEVFDFEKMETFLNSHFPVWDDEDNKEGLYYSMIPHATIYYIGQSGDYREIEKLMIDSKGFLSVDGEILNKVWKEVYDVEGQEGSFRGQFKKVAELSKVLGEFVTFVLSSEFKVLESKHGSVEN